MSKTTLVETSPTPGSKSSRESVHEEVPAAPVVIPGVAPQVIEIPKLPCEILTPCDSQYPSYTNFVLPYRVICRQRYQRCARKYRRQFLKEIRRQEIMQFRALDGIRIRREFCDPMMAPLPSEDRIKLTAKELYKLDLIINA